jgi:AsmA protein
MRKAMMIVGGLIVLLVIAAVAVGFFVDADRFRPAVEEQASQALGRQVTIGKLKLALLSGGVTADKLAIADDEHFSDKPFVTAGSMSIGVDLWGLIFDRTLNVRSFTLHSPQVNLVQNARGEWNYATLGQKVPQNDNLNKVKSSEAPAGKEPAEKSAAPEFSVAKFTLDDGKVTIHRLATRRTSEYSKLNLEATGITKTAAIPFEFSAAAPGGGTITAKGTFGPLAEESERTPMSASIHIRQLDIAATGFSDPSSTLKGLVDVDAELKNDGQRTDVDANIVGHKMCLAAGCQPATTPIEMKVKAGYLLSNKLAQLNNARIKVGGSTANVTGTVNLKPAQPQVNARVDAPSMKVNDVLGILPAMGVVLPPGAKLEGGTASVHATAVGPADSLTIKGHVKVADTKVTGYDLGKKMALVTQLTGAKVGKETPIQELSSDILQSSSGTQADNIVLIIPELGRVTGAGTVSPQNELNFAMKAVVDASKGAMGKLNLALGSSSQTMTVPFHIKGTTSDPKFIPDVGALPAAGLAGAAAGAKGLTGQTGSGTQTGTEEIKKGLGGMLGNFGK